MSSDYLEIGCSPTDESCVNVTNDYPYREAMLHECKVFKEYLERKFPAPEGAYLRTKSCPHDFGSYCEVICNFDQDNHEAAVYAYMLESHTPILWDDESKRQLRANKAWVAYWNWRNSR